MDPVSFLFIITSLVSAGISIVDSIQQDAQEARENGQFIDTGKVKAVLDSALAQASEKASGKLDNVLLKIQKLDFIQQSPALMGVIEKARQRLKDKENSLRSDISEMQGIAINNQYAYDKANTGVSKDNVNSKLEEYKKETSKQNERLQEIENRL